MYGDIEDLVLSGNLFAPSSRSNSPVRSRSPSPSPAPWPTEDVDFDYDSDAERRAAVSTQLQHHQTQQESIGMGPGRTGVKGVIRDRAEAESLARAKRANDVRELNRAMEKASLGGKTWAEEEEERRREQGRRPGSRGTGGGRYGHLREVGVRSFVRAVEEDSGVWVVVHIYDPSLDRCAAVDETLSRLARSFPFTKFLRARAGAIGFASSTGSRPDLLQPSSLSLSRFPTGSLLRSRIKEEDDSSDDDGKGQDDEDEEDEHWEDDEVDTDVLPTLLVYRAGELVHSWVRVDWEAKQGIEELLKRHNVLISPNHGGGTNGHSASLVLDDDDFSDDGEELVFGTSDDER